MGRTVAPYSHQIEITKERLSDFRRGLAKPDQEIFDEVFRVAKRQLAAGVMASNPYSMETILLSNLIQIKREIQEFKALFTLPIEKSD